MRDRLRRKTARYEIDASPCGQLGGPEYLTCMEKNGICVTWKSDKGEYYAGIGGCVTLEVDRIRKHILEIYNPDCARLLRLVHMIDNVYLAILTQI